MKTKISLATTAIGMIVLAFGYSKSERTAPEGLGSDINAGKLKTLTIQEVSDVKQWKSVYDGASAMRAQAGEVSSFVGLPVNLPRQVHVLNGWNDRESYQAHFTNEKVKSMNAKAGVKEAPRVIGLMFDNGTNTLKPEAPVTVLIYQKVKEYHIWKAHVMADWAKRAASGEIGFQAGSFSDDSGMAYVLSQWKSEADFNSFFAKSSSEKNLSKNIVSAAPTAVILY